MVAQTWGAVRRRQPVHVDATSRNVTEALETIHVAIARMDQLTRAVRESAQSNRDSVQALDERVAATTTHAETQAASSELADSALRLNTLITAFVV